MILNDSLIIFFQVLKMIFFSLYKIGINIGISLQLVGLKSFAVQYIGTHFWDKICLNIEDGLQNWNNAFREEWKFSCISFIFTENGEKKWLMIKFLSLDRWSIYLTFSHLLQVVLFLLASVKRNPLWDIWQIKPPQ